MKPKKLSLNEVWSLYKVLKKDKKYEQKEYLIDEIISIMEMLSQEEFLYSLEILYPKIIFEKYHPVELATLLVDGLDKNNFFAFEDLMKGLNNGSSIRR